MKAHGTAQLAPATALVQLLQEHPELPVLQWTLNPSGWLSGCASSDIDARAVMAQYVAVLGGRPTELRYASDAEDSGVRFGTILRAPWRDVDLYISLGCDAAVVDLPGQLAEQRHQFLDQDLALPADYPAAVATPA